MAAVKKKKKTQKRKPSNVLTAAIGGYDDEPVLQRDLRSIYGDLSELRTLVYDGQSKIHGLIEKLSKIEGQLDIIVKFAGK
jgi:hypothetical protein